MIKYIAIIFLFIISCADEGILNQSENVSKIPLLSIKIADDNLSEFRSSRVLNYYTPARLFYKGNEFSGLLRPAGSGARFQPKWSYKLDLDEPFIVDVKNFNINAQVTDPSFLRTILAKHVFEQMGFPVFKSEYANLNINSEDQGLYILLERIEEDFFRDRNIEIYELIKIVKGAKFTFEDGNTLEFNFEKKIPDDRNFTNLAEMINALDTTDVTENTESLNKFIDMQDYVRYHAVSSVINNWDSFINNFFIYKEYPNSPYKVVPWDFDNAFDLKRTVGIAGPNSIREIIWESNILRDEYLNTVEFLLNNIYTELNLFPIIDNTAAEIEDSYNIDPFLGYGSYSLKQEVAKLKEHIIERRVYLMSEVANNRN